MDLETFVRQRAPHVGEEKGQRIGFLEGNEDWSMIPEGFTEIPIQTEEGARFWVSYDHLSCITVLGSVIEVLTFDTVEELNQDVMTVTKGRVTLQ